MGRLPKSAVDDVVSAVVAEDDGRAVAFENHAVCLVDIRFPNFVSAFDFVDAEGIAIRVD